MRSTRFSRVCIAALLATLLLTTVSALAKDGRDFVGFYNFSHARSQGDGVRVTLNLQVQNLSASDVKGAVISLRQNTGLVNVGESKPIKLLRDHGSAKVSQRFTVSRTEYEVWRQGTQPTVFIVYRDAHGKWLERYIQLAPGHAF
jgi:hypothetical protein